MYKRVKGLKSLFCPAQSTNFPFGDPLSDLQPLQCLLSQLPKRDVNEALLHNYLRTFEKLFPPLAPGFFENETVNLWESHQDSARSFLAQIFMMLALSCHSAPNGYRYSDNLIWWKSHILSLVSQTPPLKARNL